VFTSSDNVWRVSLTSTSFTVSTQKYEQWEDLLSRMKVPLEAFLDIYKPAFYERVGLRYVDVFRKSKLCLDNAEWCELIEPFVVGYFGNQRLSPFVRNYNCAVEMDIGNGAIANINTFLAKVGDVEHGKPVGQPETAFVIVSNLFFSRKELNDAKDSLDYLHSVSYRLIRAMITNKLHSAMEPSNICP
jgi:uncharacterized protein (TIGR04255 family)